MYSEIRNRGYIYVKLTFCLLAYLLTFIVLQTMATKLALSVDALPWESLLQALKPSSWQPHP